MNINVADVINRCLSYSNEQEWFEFKRGTAVSKPDDVGEYISALSNAAVLSNEPRGYMIWGIDDKTHELAGTKFNYQRDISQDIHEPFQHYLSRYITPSVFFQFDEDIIEGKRVVVLSIHAARIIPTAYKDERYIRIGSSKENLKRYPEREAELFRLLNELQNPSSTWEEGRSKYHISDINQKVFERYLKTAKQIGRISIESDGPKEVLNSMQVADGDVLLNAGAAIFVDNGINELQMVRFATDERLTIIDSKRCTGCILDLTDKAVLYISEAMDWRAEFDGGVQRKEIPEVPVAAIREAVINAFAHRQIESRQAVDITIYKSFIDISSPGIFPKELEPEDFITRVIRPPRRNPLITRILYYSKDMEALATGLKRIHAECNEAGVKFEFIKDPYGFTVRFHRHCGDGWSQGADYPLSEKGDKKGDEKATKKGDEIKQRVEAVYLLIAENSEITIPMIMETLQISKKQTETALNRLKEAGRIKRDGSSNGGAWVTNV